MADPIWRRSEDLFLFHHATPESAEQIATTGVYRVGPANFLGPPASTRVAMTPRW